MSTDTWYSPFYTVDTVQRSMKGNKCDHGLWSTITQKNWSCLLINGPQGICFFLYFKASFFSSM